MRKLLAFVVWAAWVAGCEPAPVSQSPVGSVEGAALPASSATTDEEPTEKTSTANLRIECECRTGPIPAPPGKFPVTTRRVIVEPNGTVKKTTVFLQGPPLEDVSTLDPAAVAELNAMARKVFIKKSEAGAPEQPVPDGTVCVIRISEGAPMLTIQTPHPSSRPLVAPLVDALVKLLPPM